MNPDDERLARLVRSLRRDAGLTQVRLATSARVPLCDLKRIEGGFAGDVRLGRIRSVFESLDGRARVVPWWKGAAADRLLDQQHSTLVERVVRLLRARGWDPYVELSFSEFGERGSIDVFASLRTASAVAVCEVKSVIGSLEETNRMLDIKERLAPTIAFKKFGWRPQVVGRLLILPSESTARRAIESHASTMDSLYQGRGREVRSWLRNPAQPLRAIWFVSDRPNTTTISG